MLINSPSTKLLIYASEVDFVPTLSNFLYLCPVGLAAKLNFNVSLIVCPPSWNLYKMLENHFVKENFNCAVTTQM